MIHLSIERKLFKEEEDKAVTAILTAYDKAKEERVRAWLDRWYENKLPLIEAFGGLYLEGYCKEGEKEEETPEDGQYDTPNSGLKEVLMREVISWFQGSTPMLLPYVLIHRKHMPQRHEWFVSTIDDKRLNVEEVIGRPYARHVIQEESSVYDTLIISDADHAGTWGLLEHNRHLIKPEYNTDEIFCNYPMVTDSRVRLHDTPVYRNFHGVNIKHLLERIITLTPIEQLLDNKLKTGMKITKWLKTMYPDDWILFHYPQEDGKFLGYWEQFELLWSMMLQRIKSPSSNNGKPDVIVSLAPVDYLMMSENTKWKSCHQLTNNLYTTGGPAYAVDPSTAISYAPRQMMERYGVAFYDKSWRQVVHIDIPNGAAVFGREYPTVNRPIATASRRAVNYMLADYHNMSRKWWKANNGGSIKGHSQFTYAETHAPMTKLKDINRAASVDYGVTLLGCFGCNGILEASDEGRRRLICGMCNSDIKKLSIEQRILLGMIDPNSTLDTDSGWVPSRNTSYTCRVCGSSRWAQNLYRVRQRRGSYNVCRNCIESSPATLNSFGIYLCEDCNRLHHVDYVREFQGNVVCRTCYERMLMNTNQAECNRCNELSLIPNMLNVNGQVWCNDCAEMHSTVCENCDTRVSIDNATYVSSEQRVLCDDCMSCLPYCDCCENYVDDTRFIEGIDWHVCDGCLEEYFDECERCGYMHHQDHLTDIEHHETESILTCCDDCACDVAHENEDRGREVI